MSDIIELVKKARQGDEQAYTELFRQHEADIYRTAYVYLGSQEDALDVVQETAYRSFKAIRSLKEPRYFKTWLLQIAIKYAIDLLRRRKREAQWNPDYLDRITVAGEGEDVPLAISLQDMIETLSPEEKHVIVLRFYYDFTIREAAETMRVPLGTAKTLLYRALTKLRQRVEEGDGHAFKSN
ncbi:sigma-70 family RNA polymerase sigma factor [Paenibacillus silvisoli]|uniref:sigma-70 family RNA polymerase sigma factor n=1 Tax=Paenibacillus silvisoli TaxID=3110539 RepID=UPI00280654CB|nr:sigma-70 family RNA polymerase sigma factor [Paenibacillus silvisoli]